MSIISNWNELQKKLKESIKKQEELENARSIALTLQGLVHSCTVSGQVEPSPYDELLSGVSDKQYAIMPTAEDVTIAWDIWHITRIEDLTMNLLVDEGDQVLNQAWLSRLQTTVTDTGNAMTDDEIMEFSGSVKVQELLNYRVEVGKRTRTILAQLTTKDYKRKVNKSSLDRILIEGGVTSQEGSIWLLDFWGKKDIAGIILMPITRHQLVHLNDIEQLKKKLRNKETFYRTI